ncbi:transposase family protein [Actinomyces qiguomingii]|uniref:transposase family protein n=1 Tax=Actinomyces qiguomingii TaxID=2057800 RepID=UPI003CC823D2
MFATVPDPRDRRGVRHRLDVVLALAAVGVLAGCRTLLAIWEHARDLTGGQLRQLGLPQDRGIPSESTIGRALAGLDADDYRRQGRVVDAHPHRHHRRTQDYRGGRVRPCAAPNPRTTTAETVMMAAVMVAVGPRTCWRRWTRSPGRCSPSSAYRIRPARYPP